MPFTSLFFMKRETSIDAFPLQELTDSNERALAERFDPDAETTLRISRLSRDEWTFMRPECKALGPQDCTVFIHSWYVDGFANKDNPMSREASGASNTLGKAVGRHIVEDLGEWLRPDAYAAVAIPRLFEMPQIAAESASAPVSPAACRKTSLGLIFATIFMAAEEQRKSVGTYIRKDESSDIHLRWGDDADARPIYPEPDLCSLLIDGCDDGTADAIIALMRSPQYADATVDMIFERYLKISIDLLLGDRVHFLPSTDCMSAEIPDTGRSDRPLVVACGCTEFSDSIRSAMADYTEGLLNEMIDTHKTRCGQSASLPSFCFVYGIHWSISRVRILVHFPIFDSETGSWRFCQVVLAEHMHGWTHREKKGDGVGKTTADDAFLRRWRLTVALLAIRSHAQKLQEWLQPSSVRDEVWPTPERTVAKLPSTRRESALHSMGEVRLALLGSDDDPFLVTMREEWSDALPVIPEKWFSSPLPANERRRESTAGLIGQLLRNCMNMSPQCFSVESTDSESERGVHLSDASIEPYLPRVRDIALSPAAKVDFAAISWGTQRQQLGLYDMVSRHFRRWADVNVLVATCFSGVRSYELQWRPATFGAENSPFVALDFQLIVQEAPKLREFDPIIEGTASPISLINPVILLGMRTHDMNDDGATLSVNDQDAICELAVPYIYILQEYLAREHSPDMTEDVPREPRHLFCTYLKAGYVHIIAFQIHSTPFASTPTLCVVDSLPLAMSVEQAADCERRLRVFVALMTLQRRIIRLAKACEGSRDALRRARQAEPSEQVSAAAATRRIKRSKANRRN